MLVILQRQMFIDKCVYFLLINQHEFQF